MYYKFINNETQELVGLAMNDIPTVENAECVEITEEEYNQILQELILVYQNNLI